ncbi:hypothetical protein ONZ45_g36 [Pleurotus djamor]|nr:hypothetical protein ONZ45_g36 [Pleurotus djamor]
MDSVETFDSATVLASSKSSAADRAVRDALESRYVRNYWFFLSAIIASLTVFRVARYTLSRLWTSRRAPDTSEKGDAERNAPRGTGRISFRRLPDAFASGFRNLVFRCSIPIGPSSTMSVAELAFVVVYLAITLVFLFIQTRTLNPSFWQDRAAHLASCQVPLIVALAGKNNIISALTGVSHERLNVLHRAAALKAHLPTYRLPEQFNFTHNWMIAGAVALSAFSLATLLSIQPIRNAVFEVFLVSHIVLVMIFIICGYFHAGEQGFGAYFWPGLVVWASDRVLRLLRIVWNNWRRTDSTSSTANVQLLAEDTIRLTVRMRTKWTPGQHAYIIMPTISKLPTEAHPFTIASIPMTTQGSNDNEAVFLIRGRGGFTRRLKKHAMEASSEPVPVYVDGPYGCPPNLHEYSTCILIAGGSGISYTLGLFLDLIHNHTSVKSSVQRVVFVWAVRDGGNVFRVIFLECPSSHFLFSPPVMDH